MSAHGCGSTRSTRAALRATTPTRIWRMCAHICAVTRRISAATCRGWPGTARQPWRTPNRIAAVGRLWASLGTSASEAVLALAYGPDGTQCTRAGRFNSMGGVANTNGHCQMVERQHLVSQWGTGAAVGGVIYDIVGRCQRHGVCHRRFFADGQGVATHAHRCGTAPGQRWAARRQGVGIDRPLRRLARTGRSTPPGIFTTAGGVAASAHCQMGRQPPWSMGTGPLSTASPISAALTRAFEREPFVVGGRFTTTGGASLHKHRGVERQQLVSAGRTGMSAVKRWPTAG